MKAISDYSYAEKQGAKTFNWNAFLNQPISEYSMDNLTEAKRLANDWVTCACGNMCDALPREKDGLPEDVCLAKLGYSFTSMVDGMVYFYLHDRLSMFEAIRDNAKEILSNIEHRSSHLLEKQFSKVAA